MQYENEQPVVRSTVLQFPRDPFAGAAVIIALKGNLLLGKETDLALHDFNCMPGPKILKVDAYPAATFLVGPFPWRGGSGRYQA